MAIITTPGILLRSMNYRETSKIFRFYTLDHGLTSLISKGIRRKRRSGMEGLESYSIGDVTYYQKGNGDLHLLKEFSVRKSGRNLGTDIFRFAVASVLGEIVLVAGTSERNPDLYNRLALSLDRLEDVVDELTIPMLLREAWSLVATLGYRPEVNFCIKCGEVIGDEEIGRFNLKAGGILCPSCADGNSGRRLGPIAREQLMEFFTSDEDGPIRGTGGHILLLRDFVVYHIDERGRMKSFEFLISLLESKFLMSTGNQNFL